MTLSRGFCGAAMTNVKRRVIISFPTQFFVLIVRNESKAYLHVLSKSMSLRLCRK